MTDLNTKTLLETAELIRSKQTSPVELTRSMLDRINKLNDTLHAYLCITEDHALEQARIAEREIQEGSYRGPLHGIPLGIKDLINTKGIATTCASLIRKDFIPDYDATVMKRLNDAGAVALGKLSMTEFALYGYHPSITPPKNPWNTDHWSGVSSSGSGVAVAASLCFGALGTDTGGSIRYPSAANGIVGLKPTYGKVSRYGTCPLADSLDHIGPMTRSIGDAAAILGVIAGHDPLDPYSRTTAIPDYLDSLGKGVKGLRIGIDHDFIAQSSAPEVTEAAMNAADLLKGLGAELVDVEIAAATEVCNYWYHMTAAEAAATHAESFPSRAEDYGPVFKQLLMDGNKYPACEYAKGDLARARAKNTINTALSNADILLLPSAPILPPPVSELPPYDVMPPEAVVPLLAFTVPFDYTGNPTLSLPCGFSSGLPLSIQLVARHDNESLLIQAGDAYEKATDWHNQHPQI